MLAALQRKLYMDNESFDLFLNQLETTGSIITGNFPLVWACKPKPCEWHSRTRSEVLTLALVSAKLGQPLPMTFLKKLGNWLQISGLVEDLKEDRIEITIFHPKNNRPTIDWEKTNYSPNALYAFQNRVYKSVHFQKNNTFLTLVSVTGDPSTFIAYFDCSFLQTSSQVSMRGTANVFFYKRAFKYIKRCLAWAQEHGSLDGITAEQWGRVFPLLAKQFQDHLNEYDRLRFTITNLQETIDSFK